MKAIMIRKYNQEWEAWERHLLVDDVKSEDLSFFHKKKKKKYI